VSCRVQAFCVFGGGSDRDHIDNAKFAKLARDCGLLSTLCTPTDVDLIFSKSKTPGARKLTFAQFKSALRLLGTPLHVRVWPVPALQSVAACASNNCRAEVSCVAVFVVAFFVSVGVVSVLLVLLLACCDGAVLRGVGVAELVLAAAGEKRFAGAEDDTFSRVVSKIIAVGGPEARGTVSPRHASSSSSLSL
jgi:hypothetical protein